MGDPPSTDDPTSGKEAGPETSGAPTSNDRGESGTNVTSSRDSFRNRHRSGIPGRREVDPSDVLIRAFLAGDFDLAYNAAVELTSAYHEAILDGAKLRFKLNFGTPMCSHCEGLQAGPGVAATCFQARRCDYTNLKEGEDPPHQRKLINLLGKLPK